MRAAGPAPAASRPALASDASLRLQSPIDRVLWLVAAAVLAALLILLGVEHYWLRGLKFDDAYIHFRYAENIARGEGFVYNPGERVLGSGAIPWNLMLAAIAALAPPGTLPAAVSVLNYLTLLACAALLLAALRDLVLPWVGMAITAALLAQGPLVVSSVGGMETVSLCLLYLVPFLALLRRRYVVAGLAAGAAVCFRLESVFLAGVTVVAPLLHDRRQLWRALGATLLLPLLVSLWAWVYFGFPLANSTIAKRIVYSPPPLHALRTCLQAVADGLQLPRLWPRGPIAVHWARDARVVLWLPFLCLGYLVVRRRAPAAALVVAQPIGALAFYGVSDPLMFPWYTCTFVPLATLFALLGVAAAGEWVPGPRALRAVATLTAIVSLSWPPAVETWWPASAWCRPRRSATTPIVYAQARSAAPSRPRSSTTSARSTSCRWTSSPSLSSPIPGSSSTTP